MRRIVGRGSGALLVWALNLTILWTVAWALFHADTMTVVLGAWMASSAFAWAGWAWWRERRAGAPGDERPVGVVDASHATVLLGVAIFSVLLSTQFGPWLAYTAAGMALVAAGGLIRERRAERAALERAAGRADAGEESTR